MPSLALFAAAGGVGYALSRQILEDELGRSLASVAATTASQVSAERMLTIEPEDDRKGTRTYRNLLRELTEMRDAASARRIFAVDREGRLRADAGGGLPVGTEVPELARDRLELARVFQGVPTSSQVLFEGSDSRFYKTGYAPIFLDQKVVGAIGVEGSAEFFGPLRRLFRAYAALVLGALVLLGFAAVVVARGLSGPLNRLVNAALRIGAGDLETQVPSESTREIGILARELEVMRERLEGRDRQLKMMLSGVAHEVRNPIGGIELFSGLLSEELANAEGGTAVSQEAVVHLERIRNEIEYLKRIVEDFLTFARERRLNKTPLNIHQLLESARELVQADANRRKVQLRLSAEAGWIEGDDSLLLSALVNIIKNGIQASPVEGTVEIRGSADAGGYTIEVSDRGHGIPADVRSRIFEPFFTTREKGTGLGLALAQKILRAHDGRIDFESSNGHTVFRLWLPIQNSR